MDSLTQFRRLNNSIKSHAIDKINGLIGYNSNVYASELHHEIFNMDYFIIGRFQAREWLKKHYDIFDAIEKVMEYEKLNFGEVTTEIHEPERLVNMLTYILGEELLGECPTLSANWDGRLTDKELKKIRAEIRKATLPRD